MAIGSLAGMTTAIALDDRREPPKAIIIGFLLSDAGGIFGVVKGNKLMDRAENKFCNHYCPELSLGMSSNCVGLVVRF